MATKKTDKKTTKAAPKAAKKPAAVKKAPKAAKAPKSEAKPLARHPKARVTASHESKEALAKSLASAVARDGEDHGDVASRLKTASNHQLLRLHRAAAAVKEKYGDRAKLIAKLGELQKKSTDKDYIAKLGQLGLPQLLDMARSHERHHAAQ
jgi:hypothetical protein